MPAVLRLLAMTDPTLFEPDIRRWCRMKRFIIRVFLLSALLAGLAINVAPKDASSSGDIPFISIAELKAKLADPSIVILDVRIPKHIDASRFKIKGAVWVNPKKIDRWVHSFSKDATYVLY